APDTPPIVAVDAARAPVAARRYGHDVGIARVAIEIGALVSVARGPTDDASFPLASGRHAVLDGETRAVRKSELRLVGGVRGIPPIAVDGAPATRDDVRSVVDRPCKGIRLRLRPQIRGAPDGHELRSRCDTRGALCSVTTSDARTCGAVVVAEAGSRIVRATRDVSWRYDLSLRLKLLVIDVDAVVDERDRDTLARAALPGGHDVGAGVDRHLTDGGLRQMPLLCEGLATPPLPDQLGMAVLHRTLFEQPF